MIGAMYAVRKSIMAGLCVHHGGRAYPLLLGEEFGKLFLDRLGLVASGRVVDQSAQEGDALDQLGDTLQAEQRHARGQQGEHLSLIHISEPTRRTPISYA